MSEETVTKHGTESNVAALSGWCDRGIAPWEKEVADRCSKKECKNDSTTGRQFGYSTAMPTIAVALLLVTQQTLVVACSSQTELDKERERWRRIVHDIFGKRNELSRLEDNGTDIVINSDDKPWSRIAFVLSDHKSS